MMEKLGETDLKRYIAVLAALAVTLTASWIYWYDVAVEPRFILGAAVFAVLLLLADLFPVRLGERWDLSTVEIGLIAAVVVLGPFWAAISALPYAVRGGRKGLATYGLRDELRYHRSVSGRLGFLICVWTPDNR